MRTPVLALSLLAVASSAACVRVRAPKPESTPPRRSVVLSIDAQVNEIPADAKELKLWIPVPRDEGAQVLERLVPETPGAPTVVRDKIGNSALLVTLKSPAASASARASFQLSRAEQRGASPGHPVANVERGQDPAAWLADEKLTFVDDRIREIAATIFKDGMDGAAKARAAYEYVFANMKYSKEGTGWGTGSVTWACDMKYGNCTDFHALFIALLRAGKVPARFRIGFNLPPDESEGTIAGYHCWSEWFDTEQGWTPVDISEAWKNPARKEFLFGNLDNDRVGVSLGRDLVFEGQQGPALNYFVFPYAELDGKPVKVATTVSFRDR